MGKNKNSLIAIAAVAIVVLIFIINFSKNIGFQYEWKGPSIKELITIQVPDGFQKENKADEKTQIRWNKNDLTLTQRIVSWNGKAINAGESGEEKTIKTIIDSTDYEAFSEDGRQYYVVNRHADGDDFNSNVIAKRGYIEAGKYIFEISLSYKKNISKEITDADDKMFSEIMSTYTIQDTANKDGDFLVKR